MNVSLGAPSSRRWVRSLAIAGTYAGGLAALQAAYTHAVTIPFYVAAIVMGATAELIAPDAFSFLRFPTHLTRAQRRLATFGAAAYILSLTLVAVLAGQVALEHGFTETATGIAFFAIALTSAMIAGTWPEHT